MLCNLCLKAYLGSFILFVPLAVKCFFSVVMVQHKPVQGCELYLTLGLRILAPFRQCDARPCSSSVRSQMYRCLPFLSWRVSCSWLQPYSNYCISPIHSLSLLIGLYFSHPNNFSLGNVTSFVNKNEM